MKFLSEIIKGSWLIKIYQKEEEELKKISMIIDERFKAIRKVEQTRLGCWPNYGNNLCNCNCNSCFFCRL